MIKQSLRGLSLLLLLGSLSAPGCSRSSTAADKKTDSGAGEVDVKDRIMVYYFHGDRRCPTCLGIQRAIEQTIQERFGAETAARKLAFQEVNIDRDENRHFVEQFQITFSSMILARVKGETTLRWENCDQVWQLAHQPARLKDYVEERIKAYLAGTEEK